MSSEHPQEFSGPPERSGSQSANDTRGAQTAGDLGSSGGTARHEATVLVRGETVRDQKPESPPQVSPAKDRSAAKEVSPAKVELRNRLPLLDDDPYIGIQKDHIVTRDGKADLAFTGTLLACVAPPSAPGGHWPEYRIYATNGGKHVFSKVNRSVFAEERDAHEAEIFDPSPSSVPSQLLRSARDLTRSRPLTWMDAAVDFFGYDPLAKTLYRKLGGQFEEHIT
jgi:hypothetical protein